VVVLFIYRHSVVVIFVKCEGAFQWRSQAVAGGGTGPQFCCRPRFIKFHRVEWWYR